jgi:hypothetical protein
MRYKIIPLLFLLFVIAESNAQVPAIKHIRVVDTLTPLERTTRNPVILQSELDSLIHEYNIANVQQVPQQQVVQQPLKKESNNGMFVNIALLVIIALLCVLMYYIYVYQRKSARLIKGMQSNDQVLHTTLKEKNGKSKNGVQSFESKISDLHAELHKLSRENEGLNRVIKEYNGIQHEYDSLRHGMNKAYKIKNYPGNESSADESTAMQHVLETEDVVARYAFNKFLKPILLITDKHKNSPAKISQADNEKLLDLMVSLSLLYIEYLYLRVTELSVGGKMVERIRGFSKGDEPDPALLKKLDTEFGSRALVIRMALDKVKLQRLSYPVFDETNLNN